MVNTRFMIKYDVYAKFIYNFLLKFKQDLQFSISNNSNILNLLIIALLCANNSTIIVSIIKKVYKHFCKNLNFLILTSAM